MKRNYFTLLALIVVLVLLLQIGCQQKVKGPEIGQKEAETVPPAGTTGPKITFDNVVYDFGDVAAGRKYTGEFKFTNTGDGLLKITEVKKCCGVVAKLSKKEFEPGENGVLKVEYLSGPNASTMRRLLYVNSNDTANPEVVLTIKAKVTPKVAYEPQRLNLMLTDKNAGCPNITLTSLDNQPFSIKTFQSTGESITIDVDPSVKATKFVLQPKVDLEKLQNRSSGFISIELTHPECNRVYLSFNTKLRFEFKPRSIIIFNPEPQKPLIRKISLVNNYSEDFEIDSTSSENGLAKVLSQEKNANGYTLEVEITPPLRDDTDKFRDVLYVNLKGGEKLSIICYGRYLTEESSGEKKVTPSGAID